MNLEVEVLSRKRQWEEQRTLTEENQDLLGRGQYQLWLC